MIGWVVNLAKGQTLFILRGKILLLALKVILRKLLIEFMGPTKISCFCHNIHKIEQQWGNKWEEATSHVTGSKKQEVHVSIKPQTEWLVWLRAWAVVTSCVVVWQSLSLSNYNYIKTQFHDFWAFISLPLNNKKELNLNLVLSELQWFASLSLIQINSQSQIRSEGCVWK